MRALAVTILSVALTAGALARGQPANPSPESQPPSPSPETQPPSTPPELDRASVRRFPKLVRRAVARVHDMLVTQELAPVDAAEAVRVGLAGRTYLLAVDYRFN